MPTDHLATGVGALDALLAGGLEPDGLTEIYGEGGSAKTILCLQVATHVALSGKWVFYIDTEGVSVDRLEAIAGKRLSEVLRRLLVSTPKNLDEQTKAVETAGQLARDGKRPVGLIVLDSATLHYRLSLSRNEEDEGRQALGLELADLLSTSLTAHVPVVFTNQVWRDPTSGRLEPLGGTFVNHVAKTIIWVERLAGPRRRLVLLKHRSLPEASKEFRITSTGVE
jgi:DNA repair protein RadB